MKLNLFCRSLEAIDYAFARTNYKLKKLFKTSIKVIGQNYFIKEKLPE